MLNIYKAEDFNNNQLFFKYSKNQTVKIIECLQMVKFS